MDTAPAQDDGSRPKVARLDKMLTAQLEPLAKNETEGNLSLMVRKLVREALQHRGQDHAAAS